MLTGKRCLFILYCCLWFGAMTGDAARGGGRGKIGRGRGRLYSSRMPVIIRHQNPTSKNYYENKDVIDYLNYQLKKKHQYWIKESTLKKNLYPESLEIFANLDSNNRLQGRKGLPRPEITWFKDGIELLYHKFFQVHEWPMGNDTMKSKMEIDPTTQKDAGYYECQANNKYAIDWRGFRTDYVMITY